MTLPGASELFRPTGAAEEAAAAHSTGPQRDPAPVPQPDPAQTGGAPAAASREADPPKQPSRRKRHEEKITVYLSAAELMELEQARLNLRMHQGMACDRGRIVREAISMVLADYEQRGATSTLVQRLADG